jgi:hypothetical protein
MQESIGYQSAPAQQPLPLPLALNGILTPDEYLEQTEFGLLRGLFNEDLTISTKSESEIELYHPYFKN